MTQNTKMETHGCDHFLRLISVQEHLRLLIRFNLCHCSRLDAETDFCTELTSSFLFTHPSSNAGNSTPLSNVIARNAPSGSWNSANPNPWGLFAGVMRRLKEFTGPHAWTQRQQWYKPEARKVWLTESSWFKKASVIPPEIEPMKSEVDLGCGGTNCGWCIPYCC